MNLKILLIDSDPETAEQMREVAVAEGATVETASSRDEAVRLAKTSDFDVAVSEMTLGGESGLDLLRAVRKSIDLPFIFLSVKSDLDTKLSAFQSGADDFVEKPFSAAELYARICAVVRRSGFVGNKVVSSGGILIDEKSRILKIDGKPVTTTPKEYLLLKYFMQHRDEALSREKLLSEVWGYDFYGDDRTVDTHIKMLRNNLGEYRDRIVTLRSFGYKFVD